MLVFAEGGKLSYDSVSRKRNQVTLVGASAIPQFRHSTIPPFQLSVCDYNLENFSNSRVNINRYFFLQIIMCGLTASFFIYFNLYFSFLHLFFLLFLFFLAPVSKLFYVTWVNTLTFNFFTWSAKGLQNNTVNFNLVFWGFSAVPVLRSVLVFRGVLVFRCSGVPECSGVPVFLNVAVLRCPGVPGFSTCRPASL